MRQHVLALMRQPLPSPSAGHRLSITRNCSSVLASGIMPLTTPQQKLRLLIICRDLRRFLKLRGLRVEQSFSPTEFLTSCTLGMFTSYVKPKRLVMYSSLASTVTLARSDSKGRVARLTESAIAWHSSPHLIPLITLSSLMKIHPLNSLERCAHTFMSRVVTMPMRICLKLKQSGRLVAESLFCHWLATSVPAA